MKAKIGNAILSLVEGDITQQKTQAIVNAANSALRGGGGVDGAIHRAGGPKIMEECKKIGGCPPGQAVITTGGNLAAKYVIHTVGPIWSDGSRQEAEILASAYRNSLELAREKGIRSISFPSISTGAYGYPVEEASRIALETVMDFLSDTDGMDEVVFVLFGRPTYDVYLHSLESLVKSGKGERIE